MYVVETYMYNFFIKGKMNTNIMHYIQTESFESMIKSLGLGTAENLIRGGGGGGHPFVRYFPSQKKKGVFFFFFFFFKKGLNFYLFCGILKMHFWANVTDFVIFK